MTEVMVRCAVGAMRADRTIPIVERYRQFERRDMGRTISRRSAMLSAAAAVAGLATVVESEPAEATEEGQTVCGSFKVVDRRGRQRFLVDSKKPPIIIDGKTYPPSARGGPDETSCLVFNDEHGSEKGAIAASSVGALLSLDYGTGDGIHLATSWEGKAGGAQLLMRKMADPDIPHDQAKHPVAVSLSTHNEMGTALLLCDPQGRPRIRLQVTMDGVPTIAILDENGAVVKQIP